jgi:hypothetical protein
MVSADRIQGSRAGVQVMLYMVQSIAHKDQRYETVGDWLCGRGHLRYVNVSKMGNEDYEFLVGIHEQIEAWLCLKRGITQAAVDEFDKAFEAARVEGNTDEPGHDPAAPYGREHRFAEKIERLVAEELGIEWDAYDKAVVSL